MKNESLCVKKQRKFMCLISNQKVNKKQEKFKVRCGRVEDNEGSVS